MSVPLSPTATFNPLSSSVTGTPFSLCSGKDWNRSPCSLHQLDIPSHPLGISNRELSKTVCRNMSWVQQKLVFQGWHMHKKKIPLCRHWPKLEFFLLFLGLVSWFPCSVFHHGEKLFSSFWWSFYPLEIRKSSFHRCTFTHVQLFSLCLKTTGEDWSPHHSSLDNEFLSGFPAVFTSTWPQILGTFSRLILHHLINQPHITDCDEQHDSAA